LASHQPIARVNAHTTLDTAEQRRDAALPRALVPLRHRPLETRISLAQLVTLRHWPLKTRISLAQLVRLLFGKRTEQALRKPPDDPRPNPPLLRLTQTPATSGCRARALGGVTLASAATDLGSCRLW